MGEIRAALGDDPREPRYIRTVHRFGYAFCAEADETPAPVPANAGSLTPVGGAPPRCWIVYGDRETMLGTGEHVTGRASDARVHVDHVSASRRHARPVAAEASATIEDLGSKNGTWVGTRRVEGPTSLEDGDEIRVGSVRMIYRARQGPGGDADGRPRSVRGERETLHRDRLASQMSLSRTTGAR